MLDASQPARGNRTGFCLFVEIGRQRPRAAWDGSTNSPAARIGGWAKPAAKGPWGAGTGHLEARLRACEGIGTVGRQDLGVDGPSPRASFAEGVDRKEKSGLNFCSGPALQPLMSPQGPSPVSHLCLACQ